ncbi:hypothetical protein NHX12_004576 [Muraenolepis orangiensis]|uniref:Sushi domain-containing protein n=1 Tax=Muraenolepis orangiensis TaxID=630683 RepID=A0A9Q0ICB7_9TELE|nr:hypothetical protein NHX12_004576 [Muraenolepis orangiensis]
MELGPPHFHVVKVVLGMLNNSAVRSLNGTKMSSRDFAVVFLIGFAVAVNSSKPNGCSPPTLDDGYFVPEMDSYDQDSRLSYACDKLHKPDMGYWWGNSQCTNGMWNPVPKCIIRSHCSSLIIPNGEINNGDKTDHEIGDTIVFQCNEGFSPRRQEVRCENGDWNPAPKCNAVSGSGPSTDVGAVSGSGPSTDVGGCRFNYSKFEPFNTNPNPALLCFAVPDCCDWSTT